MRRWILRPLGWLFVGVLLVIILLAGAIRLDQYVLRRRGERLQADIRVLELRKSTYADARKVIDHWWNNAREGACQHYWCDAEIVLENVGYRYAPFILNSPTALAAYRRLGGRPVSIFALIRIREGVVWEKAITIHIDSTSIEPDGTPFHYWLTGNVGTGPIDPVSATHPEYRIVNAREDWVSVNFSSFADPKDVLRLTNINFSCVTRWHPCSNRSEILPAAWAEVQYRNSVIANDDYEGCTPAMIRVLSRESQHVPLATVAGLEHATDGTEVTVRGILDPKAMVSHGIYRPDLWQDFTFTESPAARLRVGDQLLAFNDGSCLAVPATQENLRAAELGANEDWSTRVHPLYLPFGEIRPPRIDVR